MTSDRSEQIADVESVDGENTAEELEETSSAVDGDDATPPTDVERSSQRRRVTALLVPLVLAVLLIGSAGFASWLYLTQFRPDRETTAAVAADTIQAATEGAVTLLSYAPDSMDKDFAAARSHLTGDFLSYYSQFTRDIVTPAVKQKSVKTLASVVQSGVVELKPESAVVLVFLNQMTTSRENPNGSFTASAVKVGLTDVGGTWLISSFDPV